MDLQIQNPVISLVSPIEHIHFFTVYGPIYLHYTHTQRYMYMCICTYTYVYVYIEPGSYLSVLSLDHSKHQAQGLCIINTSLVSESLMNNESS